MLRQVWAGALILGAIAGCASEGGGLSSGASDGAIGPEAAARLAAGDAAIAEATEIRAQLARFAPEGPDLLGRDDATPSLRGIDPAAGDAAAEDAPPTPEEIARLTGEAERLEASAKAEWERAVAIDADAQDAVLKRLLESALD